MAEAVRSPAGPDASADASGDQEPAKYRSDLLQRVLDCSRRISAELDPSAAVRAIMSEACALLQCERATVWLAVGRKTQGAGAHRAEAKQQGDSSAGHSAQVLEGEAPSNPPSSGAGSETAGPGSVAPFSGSGSDGKLEERELVMVQGSLAPQSLGSAAALAGGAVAAPGMMKAQPEVPRLAWGAGIAGAVAATGEAVVIADARQDPRFDASMDD